MIRKVTRNQILEIKQKQKQKQRIRRKEKVRKVAMNLIQKNS